MDKKRKNDMNKKEGAFKDTLAKNMRPKRKIIGKVYSDNDIKELINSVKDKTIHDYSREMLKKYAKVYLEHKKELENLKEECAKIAKQIKQSHIDGTAPIQLYTDQFEFACNLIFKAIRDIKE